MNQHTYTFHVNGMHCDACVILTETTLMEVPGVTKAKSSLAKRSVVVTGSFGDKPMEEVARDLSVRLEPHGYSLSVEQHRTSTEWKDFLVALPIALSFIVLFVALQKMGIVNLASTENFGYGTAAAIGLIASLSTCMAVVGGLVLSMSATFAREGDKLRPQILFHIGRLISFFVFGGVIGALGATFALGTTGTILLGLIIGLVMLVMGLNLLDVFHFTKQLMPSMPKFISRRALGVSKWNHALTPFLVGIATFFLPCGFTQSMQVYTLSTGGFTRGALTMLFFALGTLPVLALIGFSSFSVKKSSKTGIFFKSAGLIVIIFAIFNIWNSLVVAGLVPPLFNF